MNKKMKNQKAFIKYNFLNNLKTPLFYITVILFSVFLSINYFIKNQFFTGNGTTDLVLFFSAIPYISIIIIPALCYKHSFSNYDSFIPMNNLSKISLTFLNRFILFGIMLILIIPACLLVNLFGSIDAGQFFASFFCLIFYGASVISICTFIGCLTESKISALITQTLILALFNSAHLAAVYFNLPEFLIKMIRKFSFAWHFDSAGKGIIDTRDILWLAGTTLLFILLSAIVTEIKKGKIYTKKEKLNSCASVLLAILIMLNGQQWFLRIDLSANKTYSPSKYTKQLLSCIEQPLNITYYRSGSIAKLYPQIRDVGDFLNEYESLSKNIRLTVKDPEKDASVKQLLEAYGIQTQQFRSVTSNSTEYTNVYSAIVLEYEGNAETIPFTMSAGTLEYDLDGRVKHLITGKTRNVNIIIGNGMSLSQDYSYVQPWLNSQGFICNQLYIEDPAFVSQLENSKGPLLVIGDSQINIDKAIAIEDYLLKNKGAGLFMVSPYSTNIEEDWYITANKRTNLVEMLENWGVGFTGKVAADISCARIQMYDEDNTHTQIINYPLWPSILQQKNTALGITLFWPVVLELSENAEPYIFTSPASFEMPLDFQSKEKLLETNPFLLENTAYGDKDRKPLTVCAKINGPLKGLYNLEATNSNQIIVIPDPYFLNSLMAGYIGGDYGDYRNFEFLTTTLLKLNGEEDLAELQSRSSRDTSFYKVTDINQFSAYRIITLFILFVLIPLSVIISGAVFNVIRKHEKK